MKVLFISGPEFLRTKNKTNPFFDPIIDVCKKNDIDWRILLPNKSHVCGYPAERVRDFSLLAKLGAYYWKIIHFFTPKAKTWNVYRQYGRLLKPFFKKLLDCDVAVTIAGYLEDEFQGICPERRIVDLQHGVIYSKHTGYFNADASLRDKFKEYKNREFWLYGQGYADCFFKNPENHKWLDGRVKVIGDLLHANHSPASTSNTNSQKVIAVSLQFTDDFSFEVQQSWADDLSKVFEQIEAARLQKRYPVVMRHHPRYSGKFDMKPMMARFPWLTVTKETTPELIARSVYHITYMSTSAFEYAAEGVPTLFTASEKNRVAVEMMYDEFGYPIPLAFEEMAKALDNPQELERQGELVKTWYRKFYTPFDEKRCFDLLLGKPQK